MSRLPNTELISRALPIPRRDSIYPCRCMDARHRAISKSAHHDLACSCCDDRWHLLFSCTNFHEEVRSKYGLVLGSGLGQVAALAIPILLSAFFYLRTPSIDALKIIGPVLVSLWLIGIETLFFFQKPKEAKLEKNISTRFKHITILLGYGILVIPSRVPSLLDGFPWNTPLEFITANSDPALRLFFLGGVFSPKRQ